MSTNSGCKSCWPDSAEEAWQARGALSREADLIDESHFHVMILKCPSCSQQFVSVFTETIDWVDGEDPQYWTTLPLTPQEAVELIQLGCEVSEGALDDLGRDRRSLHRDYPKGEEPRAYWGTGICLRFHD